MKWSSKVPKLDYEVKVENGIQREKDIYNVCKRIFPHWSNLNGSDMKLNTIKGGITNLLFSVTVRYDEKNEDTVLVRLYGKNTEVLINRDIDCENFEILSEKGFGPKLHGLFINGRVEGFFDAFPLEPPQMGQVAPIDFVQLISKELALMNSLDMPRDTTPQLWILLDKWKDIARTVVFEDERSNVLEKLELENFVFEMLEKIRFALPSPENGNGMEFIEAAEFEVDSATSLARRFLFDSVFCHNDLLSGNILCLKNNSKKVQFVDFEYGCYNFRGFDIANHFCEYAGFDSNFDKSYPDVEKQKYFIKCYVAEAAKLTKDEEMKEKLLESLSNEKLWVEFSNEIIQWLERFAIASHLFWGTWAVIQAKYSPIDFDFLEYARLRFVPINKLT